jgi:hypothetical protein
LRRILSTISKILNKSVMKKTIFLFLATLFLTFSLNAQTPSVSQSEPVIKRTVSRVMEKTIDGKQWEVTLNNDEVAEVKMAGKKLPKSAWAKYQSQIDNLRSAAYEMDPEAPIVPKEGTLHNAEVHLADGGDLTTEQKATHKAIEDELMSDKLIANRTYKLLLTENSMVINGKTMSKEMTDKYITLYYAHSGEQRCEGCRFKIQLNKK